MVEVDNEHDKKIISGRINKAVHYRVKLYCAVNGLKMERFIEAALDNYIQVLSIKERK